MELMIVAFSHLGICVSDMDRSMRFYCDGLGFTPGARHEIGDDFATLMELDEVALQSQFIHHGELAIELLFYVKPGHHGPAERRSLTQLGLTHLNLKVDDVEAVASQIRAHGGQVHEHTRTTFPGPDGPLMDFVYCSDPDGVRIELMRLPGPRAES
jgi:catechol 2,3-dioxygenase-like lactoylglutathione lyase family enzyme